MPLRRLTVTHQKDGKTDTPRPVLTMSVHPSVLRVRGFSPFHRGKDTGQLYRGGSAAVADDGGRATSLPEPLWEGKAPAASWQGFRAKHTPVPQDPAPTTG